MWNPERMWFEKFQGWAASSSLVSQVTLMKLERRKEDEEDTNKRQGGPQQSIASNLNKPERCP